VVIAIFLVQWRLKLPKKQDLEHSKWEKLKRVDFIGAFFLCYTIFAACFVLDVGGQKFPWDTPIIIGVLLSGVTSAVLFTVSAKVVQEPIFPLRLITHYDLVTNYVLVLFAVLAQMSLMMSVPIYFQATKNANTAAAGAYLIPAFVGNTLGGLLAGYWIRRTGKYKYSNVLAPILSLICMALCLLRWNGDTSVWESLYIFPGGFATGMISNSAFVGMAAGVDAGDIAIAGSGMYLFFSIGAVSGASSGGAAYQLGLRSGLHRALENVGRKNEVCNVTLFGLIGLPKTWDMHSADTCRCPRSCAGYWMTLDIFGR
jgi:hypothetical protein